MGVSEAPPDLLQQKGDEQECMRLMYQSSVIAAQPPEKQDTETKM